MRMTNSPTPVSYTHLDVYKRQDVLKDDGEAYAKKLMRAGVNVTAVQIQGTIHDFVMLNVLDQTNACRTAMNLSTDWICQKNVVLLDSR